MELRNPNRALVCLPSDVMRGFRIMAKCARYTMANPSMRKSRFLDELDVTMDGKLHQMREMLKWVIGVLWNLIN